MQKVLWIALGGALGTLARFGVTAAVQRLAGPRFPWGTVAVNVLGCFLFGLVWAYTERRTGVDPVVRLATLTGFMGAFTTFSTYIFDCGQLGEGSRYGALFANIVGQNAAGLLCLVFGLALGRAL